MNLAIDIGNSSIKVGSFNSMGSLLTMKVMDKEELQNEVHNLNPDRIIVSSVAVKINESTFPFVKSIPTLILKRNTPLPFTLDYKTPETLGVDRIAAIAGALEINPGGVSMVIDAGTCITYDLLDKGDIFRGGIISPGVNLRFKAMNHYTGNLPLIEYDWDQDKDMMPESLIGKSTREAMISGVINGINGEVQSFIDQYMELFPEMKVILCGGEAKFFESRLKAPIFAVPELVLVGLNRILDYNG